MVASWLAGSPSVSIADPEHVLDDRQPALGRDNDAVDAEHAMGKAGTVLLQHHERRRELPDQCSRACRTSCLLEDLGEPLARRVVGDDREALPALQELDGPNAGEGRMLELAEASHALAQRRLEAGC